MKSLLKVCVWLIERIADILPSVGLYEVSVEVFAFVLIMVICSLIGFSLSAKQEDKLWSVISGIIGLISLISTFLITPKIK